MEPKPEQRVWFEPSSIEIERSWRRSQLSGIRPDGAVLAVEADLVEGESRFMRAARDILDRSSRSFEGSDLTILVADSSCRIVRRWSGTKRAAAAMDSIGAVTGSDFSEERLGTNGLGTPFELRRQIVVNGSDHYLHPLHSYSCFGMPILNPMTHRIEGVVDITSLDGQTNPLFEPFIAQIVSSIQDELVSQSKVSEQRTFSVFRDATKHSHRAIAAICGDLVLTNNRASELLREADNLVLHEVASGLGYSEHRTLDLPQDNGGALQISAHRIEGTVDGTLFSIDLKQGPRSSPTTSSALTSSTAMSAGVTSILHIVGEPGSGRTTLALSEAAQQPLVHIMCTESVLDEKRWLARLVHELHTHVGVLVLDDIDLLSTNVAARIASCAFDRPELAVVMTSVFELDATGRQLASVCDRRIATKPLRDRTHELAQVISELSAPERRYSPTTAVLSLLKTHIWPGNMTELARVLAIAASSAGSSIITVEDLPPDYRRLRPSNFRATNIDDEARAEITAMLTRTNGDKKAAAHKLGISRTTLYTRMRQLKIY
jgi:transcriptional regulator of acetoin/glycerol metabolism